MGREQDLLNVISKVCILPEEMRYVFVYCGPGYIKILSVVWQYIDKIPDNQSGLPDILETKTRRKLLNSQNENMCWVN